MTPNEFHQTVNEIRMKPVIKLIARLVQEHIEDPEEILP